MRGGGSVAETAARADIEQPPAVFQREGEREEWGSVCNEERESE